MTSKKAFVKIWMAVVLMLLSVLPLSATNLSEEDGRRFDYFFMEACRMKMKGNIQKSGEMFQNCLKIDPESAVCHFELGKLLLMTGNENDALNFLRRAVYLNNKNDWYQIYLAGVYEQATQYLQAIEIYEELHKKNPSKEQYCYHLGDLYTKTKQYIKAVEIYDAIEKQDGMSEALSLEKERLYLLAGEEKKALAELNRLSDKYPDDERYQIMLGDYYMAVQNPKMAKKAYDKAETMDAENGFLHMSLSMYYKQAGDTLNSNNELKKAFESSEVAYEQKMQILFQYMMTESKSNSLISLIEDMTKILKTEHPEEPSTYFFYANYLIEDTTKTDIVVENLEKTVALDAENDEAWMQLIRLAFRDDDFMKALAYAEDAELGGVKTPYLYFYRGIAAQQIKDVSMAKSAFETGVAITGDDSPIKPQLLGSLGDIYYEMDSAKRAFSFYDAALELDNHNVMVMNNYAYYLSEEDTLLAKAEMMSARCIELEPGNATYLDTYAWILYKRNDVLLAKFYMEKAIHNMEGGGDVLYDHYGDILYANDNKEEAKIYWQKAIDAGGDVDTIKPKIDK